MNYHVYIDIETGPEWHIATTMISVGELNPDTRNVEYNTVVYFPELHHYADWEYIESLPSDCLVPIYPPNVTPSLGLA